ncbi:hypothetical protein GCM10022261_27170 [Brevibacterium daeguense]|uniref:Uncharacterized protein n=1 Tax=Brevibacterium daeguense TaxID=909936 RepID=A0ABP8EMF4_9MICO|nr:hypothetical protein [Brevibacterium daeguense]
MSDDENTKDSAGNSGSAGDPGKSPGLTPDLEAGLHKTLESIQRSLSSVQPPRYTLPESTLKNIASVSRIAEAQQAQLAQVIKPLLNAQPFSQTQVAMISSDIFKSHRLTQSTLNRIASQLNRNTDFGIAESATRAANRFVAQQTSWLQNIVPAVDVIPAAFYPPNLRDIDGLRFVEVEQVVMVDGIPLYGLPRPSTSELLIRADGARKRRDILGRRWKSISTDCRRAVEDCGSDRVAPYIRFVLAALDALEAGHTEAAQALAGSLIDTILNAYFGIDRYKYTPNKRTRTTDAYDEFSVRQFIAFAPLWQTYQQYFPTNGDRVPMAFNRHATAHKVSPRQFNRRNAVQGIMFACSLIYRLDEESPIS